MNEIIKIGIIVILLLSFAIMSETQETVDWVTMAPHSYTISYINETINKTFGIGEIHE